MRDSWPFIIALSISVLILARGLDRANMKINALIRMNAEVIEMLEEQQ